MYLDAEFLSSLSDAIGLIYDCALDPQKCTDACRKVADLCESTAGGICAHEAKHAKNDQLFVFGYTQDFLQTLDRHFDDSPMVLSDSRAFSLPRNSR